MTMRTSAWVSAAFLFCLVFGADYAHAQSAKFEYSGWLPYWREEGVADVKANLDKLTEINPFGYIVQKDGVVHDAMGINDEPWKSLIAEAKKKKIRVIPTVMWSDAEAMHRILGNQTTRAALVDDIVRIVNNEGFSGIDIDFEGKYAETKDHYSAFLKELYKKMGNKWVMCTIEPRTPLAARYSGTPPAGAGIYANDFAVMNKNCDRVRIMTYDQGTIDVKLNAAAKSQPYVPIADPKWVEKVVIETAKSISKHKLVVGVATYGYEYEVRPLSGSGYRYDRQWSFNPAYASEVMQKHGLRAQRSLSGEMMVSYLPAVKPARPTGNTLPNAEPLSALAAPAAVAAATLPFNLLVWSDATAVKQKIDLAKRLGVRGVAIFKLDGAHDPALWGILTK